MIDRQEITDRMVETLARTNKDRKMTRKVDTYEYEALADCIRSDQVPAQDIAEFFKPGKVHQFEGLEDGVAFELYWAEFNHDDIVRRTVGTKVSK